MLSVGCVLSRTTKLKDLFVKRGTDFAGRPTTDAQLKKSEDKPVIGFSVTFSDRVVFRNAKSK